MSRSSRASVWALAAVVAAGGLAVRAQDDGGAEVSIEVPVLSAYVWRGQVLSDEAVLQPSLSASKAGFGINVWANMALTDATTGDEFEFTEYDYTLTYSFPCKLVQGAEWTVGLVDYSFPNQSVTSAEGNLALVNDTREAFATYTLAETFLSPAVSVYYDFKEADGFYVNLGVSHEQKLSEKASLVGGFTTGFGDSSYNAYYFGVDDDKVNDGNLTVALPYALTDAWTLTAGAQYTWLWDSDIEDAADAIYLSQDQFLGSLKASYTF